MSSNGLVFCPLIDLCTLYFSRNVSVSGRSPKGMNEVSEVIFQLYRLKDLMYLLFVLSVANLKALLVFKEEAVRDCKFFQCQLFQELKLNVFSVKNFFTAFFTCKSNNSLCFLFGWEVPSS